MSRDKRKQSLYLGSSLLGPVGQIAATLGVSMSKVVQDCVALGLQYSGPLIPGTLLPFPEEVREAKKENDNG